MTHFPTKTLLLPPLAPLAVWLFTDFIRWRGHEFNVHGDFILVTVALLSTGLIALLTEGYAVVYAWRLLRAQPALRTPGHCLAFGVGAAYLLAVFALVATLLCPVFFAL